MRTRAAVILMQYDAVALIERWRGKVHYYVFPGGGVEAGELPAAAAAREAYEELGVHVRIGQLLAIVRVGRGLQYYYLGQIESGVFGTGMGEEYGNTLAKERGTYRPVWMAIIDLPQQIVVPHAVAELVVASATSGWPQTALQIEDHGS